MKVKLPILIIILVFLSGCSATYNLIIEDDNFAYEEVTLPDYEDFYSEEDITEVIPSLFSESDNISYDLDDYDNLVISRYRYDYNELNEDKVIDDYFGKLKINSKKMSFKPNYDTCIFMFSDGGEYVTNDKIEVNVTLPFKISKTNADIVDGNTYTWIYSINDCNKEAYIKVRGVNAIIYVIIGVLITCGIVYFIIRKIRKSNEL